MKPQRILFAVLLSFVFATCKKDDDKNIKSDDVTAQKMVTMMLVQSQAADLYAQTLAVSGGDSLKAMNDVAQWIIDQPEVDKAYFWSTGLLEVLFKNGLRSHLVITGTDANGQHLLRGAGGGNVLKRFGASAIAKGSSKEIPNKKVLILNAFMQSMYDGSYTKKNMFPKDFEVDVFNDYHVTYDLLSTLDDGYGFIILNTHGLPNGFFLIDGLELKNWKWNDSITNEEVKVLKKEIIDSISVQMHMPLEKFENGELEYNLMVEMDGYHISRKWAMVSVTDKYIRNSSLAFDQTILYGNHCWSGYTLDGPNVKNLSEAWKSKGVVAYYGYALENGGSGFVWNDYAKKWEDSLIVNLLAGDSTGVAHLANDDTLMFHRVQVEAAPELVTRGIRFAAAPAEPLYFTQFFSPNYSYEKCGDTITDTRDGQKYPTVCIGEQVWMAKNLNYSGGGSLGVCFDSDPNMCIKYGRLYKWSQVTGGTASSTNPSGVRGICPAGWHVPSQSEWQELITYIGGESIGAGKLRSTSSLWEDTPPGTDNYGFAGLPGGQCEDNSDEGHICFNSESEANFWTASKSPSNLYQYILIADIIREHEDYGQENNITSYFSCRCVKDK